MIIIVVAAVNPKAYLKMLAKLKAKKPLINCNSTNYAVLSTKNECIPPYIYTGKAKHQYSGIDCTGAQTY